MHSSHLRSNVDTANFHHYEVGNVIEEAAGLIVWCRNGRVALLKGEDFDVGKYTTATNSLRRLLADIGQERRLKDVTPDLHSYLKQKAASDTPKASAGMSDDGAQE